MMHEMICSWLGLPPDCWPPDHYRLLGLDVGEGDVALIEQRVHQRLDSLRRYQMMYPEQATEAMNRLAQAFVCLTEPAAKQAYDEQFRPPAPPAPVVRTAPAPTTVVVPASPPPVRSAPPPPVPQAPEPPELHEWLYTPGMNGPLRSPLATLAAQAPPAEAAQEVSTVTAPPPASATIDPIRDAAQRSEAVRRGLGTRRALFERVKLTRQLQRLWHRLGKYINDPTRALTRADALDLKKLLDRIADDGSALPLLGEAGQPGHLLLTLTQLDRSKDLLSLDQRQRESLKSDWDAGFRFLELHREFLRGELAADRQRGSSERLMRAFRGWLNDKPLAAVLVFGGLLAIAIAWARWWIQNHP